MRDQHQSTCRCVSLPALCLHARFREIGIQSGVREVGENEVAQRGVELTVAWLLHFPGTGRASLPDIKRRA